jgi:DNA-binding NtrC family response regulator
MPPLRSRPGDIGPLVMHFLARYAAENGKAIHGITDEALARLQQYEWPGNVRELENAIERAVVVCPGDTIRLSDLAPSITPATGQTPRGYPPIPGSSLADLERFAILTTLEHFGGATSRAADMLRISPRKIQYKLQEYRGEAPKPRPGGSAPTDEPDSAEP